MSEAAAAATPPEPAPTLEDLLARHATAMAAAERAMTLTRREVSAVAGDRIGLIELANRIADCQLMQRQVGEALQVAAGRQLALRTLLEAREEVRARPVPEQEPARPRRHRHAAPRGLRSVQGVAVAAFAGLKGGLRHPVGSLAGHVVTAQHVALAAAGGAIVVAAPFAAVAALPGTANAHEHPPAAASLPGWHTTGVPITVPAPIDGLVTHPGAASGLDARSGRPVTPVPWYLSDPPVSSGQSQSSPSSQPSQAPAPVVQAVLEPVTGTLDLTSGVAQVITVSAGGNSGWVAWHIDAGGSDLDFSPDHGVLQAGQSATVTVSVDPAQALDGNLLQTFTVNGSPVAVTLPPLPVPLPTVVPSDVASALPSVLPS